MWSVQREPTLILSLHRQLQLPHRLWLERPLRPHSPPTSLQVPYNLSPHSLSLSKKPHLLILLLQGSVDDRRGTGVASRHASPRRASLCHEAARTQRSGLRHRAGLQIRSSHHVRAVSLTKGEPFFFFFFFQNSIFFEYCVLL